MSQLELPLVVEPDALERHLGAEGLLVVDLSKPEVYSQLHVPGAVHLDYGQVIAAQPPRGGLLPDTAQLSRVLSAIGLTPDRHVVACDDEGGGKACRLLWTLDVLGHRRYSLLDGGLHAWANEQHPLDNAPAQVPPTDYQAKIGTEGIADWAYVLEHLQDPEVALLDCRTPEEYQGIKRLAARGGHIPGAVNLEWTRAMDPNRNLRLRPVEELRATLESLGLRPDREVITYCQTHHRSAHTYILLKALGYPRVRGYPGSWSDWGNRSDTPIE
ncbi:MAG: thiosulfate sulfurtransferase [Chromatiales bacterium 21-64-14]|nr:MAG: thiosulfate sulfurtransferase [Chromatiales bacterium 21-64-14]HQU16740.1 sulfurtransferase [Gammaproteobacteria bacterium]